MSIRLMSGLSPLPSRTMREIASRFSLMLVSSPRKDSRDTSFDLIWSERCWMRAEVAWILWMNCSKINSFSGDGLMDGLGEHLNLTAFLSAQVNFFSKSVTENGKSVVQEL